MKIRQIRKLIPSAENYTIAAFGAYGRRYIGIGHSLVHDLLKIEVDNNFSVSYALGFPDKYSAANVSEDIKPIWDEIFDAIGSRELQKLIEGDDTIDSIKNPVKVYSVKGGSLIESWTEEVDYPNITLTGELIYINTHFNTAEKALQNGIKDQENEVAWIQESIEEMTNKIADRKTKLEMVQKNINAYKELLTN